MKRLLMVLLLGLWLVPSAAQAATVRVGVVEDKARDRWGFNPGDLTIAVGDTVRFVNDGDEVHTFEANSGLFNSNSVNPGGSFSFTFTAPGDVSYVCSLHPRMEGVIRVRAGEAAQSAADFPIPGGWFFTQTGGGGGRGYAVTDDSGVRFWSELQRLGGVQAVGYPASQRFEWDGFTVQVFQRVVFQWRPDQNAVNFVNVFDRLHDLGKDEFLRTVRQTPPPRAFADGGKSFDEVVRERLAVLDASPAIKAKFFSAVGDPVQANGLPVSDPVDMGDAVVLRAQRVVFQEWTRDVPWARAGEVTVALGGDIAKEAGILPDAGALQPTAPPGGAAFRPAPSAAGGALSPG